MFLFYCIETENGLVLSGDDHRHATKVLRKREGDEIICTDGKGYQYACSVKEIGKIETTLQLISKTEILKQFPNLHIGIALTKNTQRIEWFVEKATEIGIGRISLLKTKRTERSSIKLERIEKIAISAMKQSQRYIKPRIDKIMGMASFVENLGDMENRLVAHYHETNPTLSSACIGDTVVCVGPEGDFTKEEIIFLKEHGFKNVNMGDHRLRTETAGIVACHTFNLINNG